MTKVQSLKPILWTLEQGLSLVRDLQPLCHALSFHVALGGGVINKGESRKDLDLYFLPFDNEESSERGQLLKMLARRLGPLAPLSGDASQHYCSQSTYRFKLKARSETQRIDIFIL